MKSTFFHESWRPKSIEINNSLFCFFNLPKIIFIRSLGGKSRCELHKDAKICFEQILQSYGHLQPIMQAIQVRYIRHAVKIRTNSKRTCPGGSGWRMHWLHLCRGVTPPNKCPGYDTKQSDGEVPVILELWRMQCTTSLPSFPGLLWPRVVALDSYQLKKN